MYFSSTPTASLTLKAFQSQVSVKSPDPAGVDSVFSEQPEALAIVGAVSHIPTQVPSMNIRSPVPSSAGWLCLAATPQTGSKRKLAEVRAL